MNAVREKLSKLKLYSKLPEFRIFWVFLPILIGILAINIYYLPERVKFFSISLIAGIGVFMLFSSYKSAGTNFSTRLEKNELKSVILNLKDALVVYDKNFKVAYFNPSAERLFRIKASDIIGKQIRPQDAEDENKRLLIQVIFPSLVPNLVIRSKPGEYPQIADLSFDNPRLELRVITSAVSGENNVLYGFMKIITDRTREIELLKSKSEFITVASHQLRTPATEIKWAVDALSGEKGLSDNAKVMLENLKTSSQKLINIIEDLLNVSRIESGRFGYNFKKVNIIDFLNGLLSEAMDYVRKSGLKLYFNRPQEKLPDVIIDTSKIAMVISNLIDNAIRYNVENGEIIVSARRYDNKPFVEIAIRDTGIGIPEDEISKISNKFYRASNALKISANGSGLGLYIARNIIRSHGGNMWIESEIGRGTIVHFTLPTDQSIVPTKEVPLDY